MEDVTPIITRPATQPYRIVYETGDHCFGIRLRPEHGAALWQNNLDNAPDSGLRGPEALDRLPSLAVHRGSDPMLDDLARIVHAQTWPEVDPRLTRAIVILHASGGRLRFEALAKFVACTARHLNRLFRRNVGLTAKNYAQLIQFHRTLKLITNGDVPIVSAAFEGGYSDHAHMARNFRRFGGFTPSGIPTELSLPGIPSK